MTYVNLKVNDEDKKYLQMVLLLSLCEHVYIIIR